MKRRRTEYMKTYMQRYRSFRRTLNSSSESDLKNSSDSDASHSDKSASNNPAFTFVHTADDSDSEIEQVGVALSQEDNLNDGSSNDGLNEYDNFLIEPDDLVPEDSDTSSDESDDESVKPACQFLDKIAQWAATQNTTREGLNELLAIFRWSGRFMPGDIPKDCRTILHTPRLVNVIDKCNGQYVYLGIKKGIIDTFRNNALDDLRSEQSLESGCVTVDINIDGVPIQSSNNLQFWPILCRLVGLKCSPFPIGMYSGKTKPSNVMEFLEDLIVELNELLSLGFTVDNCHYSFNLRCFICDAPARAFVKCIASHNAKHGCERCTTIGQYIARRVVFTSDICTPRLDDAFRDNTYLMHKTGDSPLLSLDGINMITCCVLDPMHLLFLGVCRRFLSFLKSGPNVRLSHGQLDLISKRLLDISKRTPSEFARKPRSILELERWKATEFRQFTLYTGIVALKGIVDDKLYNLFLGFSVAIRLLHLDNPVERNKMLPFARKLLVYFVHNSRIICGDEFVTYNVHNLLHIADDVEHHNCSLSELSAFPFENFLQCLKRIVRNAKSNPLVSAVKRIQERSIHKCPWGYKITDVDPKVSTKTRDKYFISKDGKFCEVEELNGNQLSCRVISKKYLQPVFLKPVDSSKYDIVQCNNSNMNKWKTKLLDKNDVFKKLYCMTNSEGSMLFFPILHNTK